MLSRQYVPLVHMPLVHVKRSDVLCRLAAIGMTALHAGAAVYSCVLFLHLPADKGMVKGVLCAELRRARLQHKKGQMSEQDYEKVINDYIKYSNDEQERIGLDVFVHGEPERTDMCAPLSPCIFDLVRRPAQRWIFSKRSITPVSGLLSPVQILPTL